MAQAQIANKERPDGRGFYSDLADYVTYANGYTISDAEFLDIDYIDFIEGEIKQGSKYAEADLSFQIEQELR